MKRKPTSVKKHKKFRRVRRANWDESREKMERLETMADEAANKYLEETFNANNGK